VTLEQPGRHKIESSGEKLAQMEIPRNRLMPYFSHPEFRLLCSGFKAPEMIPDKG
jgi:hypothetical protein